MYRTVFLVPRLVITINNMASLRVLTELRRLLGPGLQVVIDSYDFGDSTALFSRSSK